MKIGYTTKSGTSEYEAKEGQLIIIVDAEECHLQEYLVQTLLNVSEHEDEKAPLREVMQYVQVSYGECDS